MPSYKSNIRQLRQDLVNDGTVVDGVFATDYIFGSPSTAASCIFGGNLNGKALWKNESGVTIKNMYSDKDDSIDEGQLSLNDIVSD